MQNVQLASATTAEALIAPKRCGNPTIYIAKNE